MTTPSDVARDLATWATGGVDSFNGDSKAVIEAWTTQFEKALTAQYRAGLMRAAEIAEMFNATHGAVPIHINKELAKAIRTEADRLRGNGE